MRILGWLLLLGACSATTACAKPKSCELPADLPRPMLEGPTSEQPRRIVPTQSYTLSVSWSPQYCAGRETSPKDQIQCGTPGRYGFTLHGLWPDGAGDNQWPQYCRPTRLVPDTVIREEMCVTPSVQLIQHEWEKHGTCDAKTPGEFFKKSRKLFDALHFPDMTKLSGTTTTAAAFRQAVADANAKTAMRADQVDLMLSKEGWLQEVHICLDKALQRRSCPAGPVALSPDQAVRIK